MDENEADAKIGAQGPKLRALAIGRPKKNAVPGHPLDKTLYTDPAKFRSVLVSQCIKELLVCWPFIDLNNLRRLVNELLARKARNDDPLKSLGMSERDILFGDTDRVFGRLSTRRVVAIASYEDFCDYVFGFAPTKIQRREAVVRVLMHLHARDAEDTFRLPLANSRAFAVASFAAVDEKEQEKQIHLSGGGPWCVGEAIKAEGKAVLHQLKKLAKPFLMDPLQPWEPPWEVATARNHME